ncbi:hypothetical protein CASFOL_035923 [Castilleja foliolosa]|uniref:HMA domain-containing protein n=1 Tax=Castilleja foliolosa TaxID=1961234 RepID=A0ABD3BVL7_9LAMI
MENHRFYQNILLSMDMSCCERCRRILKTKLLNMHGVVSVSIDLEKDVVMVSGPVDPMTLLNEVAKFGKKVRLLPNNVEPNNKHRQKHTHLRFDQDHPNVEEPHRCEPYEPPMVYDRVDRDFYSEIHPRSFDSHVSGKGSFFGGWPFSGGGGGFGPPHMHPAYRMRPPYFGGHHRLPLYYGCHRPRPFSSFYEF